MSTDWKSINFDKLSFLNRKILIVTFHTFKLDVIDYPKELQIDKIVPEPRA